MSDILIQIIISITLFLIMVQVVPLLVWVERRGSAFMQNRVGPNRVGPLGLTQLLADAVKFIFKEEFVPSGTRKFLFYAAPVASLIPAALAMASLPLSSLFTFGDSSFVVQGYRLGVGIIFVLGVSSLGAYSMLMAGWSSSNKYSLFGALRASAQMISYELGLGLALVGILLVYGTLDFTEMVAYQNNVWGVVYQPIGALLFFVCVFAETNRLPFDLPEAEAELVAGYHTEYGGLKMNMFYIGEYGHMIVASALMAIFYFGGYNLFPGYPPEVVTQLLIDKASMDAISAQNVSALLSLLAIGGKIAFFLWVFVWVRWSLPRFRFDQLMDLGWKTILPWALANTVLTAAFLYFTHS